MYQYRAKIVRVIDGDTFTADIDLGFGIIKRAETFRVSDGTNTMFDTPETFRPKSEAERAHGLQAKSRAIEILEGREVIVQTFRDEAGKYGRFLADVLCYADDSDLDAASVGKTYTAIFKDEDLLKLDSYPGD